MAKYDNEKFKCIMIPQSLKDELDYLKKQMIKRNLEEDLGKLNISYTDVIKELLKER